MRPALPSTTSTWPADQPARQRERHVAAVVATWPMLRPGQQISQQISHQQMSRHISAARRDGAGGTDSDSECPVSSSVLAAARRGAAAKSARKAPSSLSYSGGTDSECPRGGLGVPLVARSRREAAGPASDQAGDAALPLASRRKRSSIQAALLSGGAGWRDGARMPPSPGSCAGGELRGDGLGGVPTVAAHGPSPRPR
jgi:hypothetical protein